MRDKAAENLVVRLIKETSSRSVKWSVEDVPRLFMLGTDDVYSLFLETRFKEKRIALFELKYQDVVDGEVYWTSTLVIAMLDYDDRVLWQYKGYDAEMVELFSDARRSLEDVDAFLNYFR